MSSVARSPMQSRWGYHPCSYEAYRKLKYLSRRHWETLRAFHQRERCLARTVRRIGPEPSVCPAFSENRVWLKPFFRRNVRGFERFQFTFVGRDVPDLYRRARTPQPEPPTPFSDSELKRIDALYQEVQGWYND